MRPSLRDLQRLEAFLRDQLPPEEREQFQQRLLLDPELYAQLRRQKHLYRLIRQRGRRTLRRELNQLHEELFSDRTNRNWQQRILSFFSR